MSLRAKLGMLAFTARVSGHYLGDRLRRPTPGPRDVPISPEALTPDWLTAHLCAAVPGARVDRFEISGRTDGTSSRRLLTVTYNEAGRAAELPERLFVKATPTLLTRLVCGMNGLLASEANFYNQLRPDLDIEAPTGYTAVYDTTAARSLFLLEDIASTRGASFAGPTDRYVDRAMAEDMIDLMAAYHARYWNVRHQEQVPWLLDARRWFLRTHDMANVDKLTQNGIRKAESVLPKEFTSRGGELWTGFLASLDAAVSGPRTVVHQDVHAGNWYVTDKGRMGLYDWQCMAVGCWAIDVAYALMSGLTIADRRSWERELVERYRQRLTEHGVADVPTGEQAWLAYRQQAMHGLVFWVFTIGAGPLQPDMQPREICLANLERMGQAVTDLATLDSYRPEQRPQTARSEQHS